MSLYNVFTYDLNFNPKLNTFKHLPRYEHFKESKAFFEIYGEYSFFNVILLGVNHDVFDLSNIITNKSSFYVASLVLRLVATDIWSSGTIFDRDIGLHFLWNMRFLMGIVYYEEMPLDIQTGEFVKFCR